MASRIFGSAIKRREDPRLITGQAKYTDDFVLPGMAHLAVVRSPYAHAKIKAIRTKKAAGMPGVLGVFTGKDMKDAGFGPIPCAWVVPGSDTKTPPYPPIAHRRRALRRQRRRDRRRRGSLRRARRRRRGRGRLRPAAVGDRRREGDAEGPAAAPRRRAEQRLLPLEGLGRRRRRGVQGGRRRGQGTDHQPAPDPQRDGGARGAGAVPLRQRRSHALGDLAEPAHRPLPAVARHGHPGAQDPRHRARSRRRLRQQDPPLPRGHDGDLRLEDAVAARSSGPRRAARTTAGTIHGRDHIQDVEMAAKKDGTILGAAREGLGEPRRATSRRPRPASRRSCTA